MHFPTTSSCGRSVRWWERERGAVWSAPPAFRRRSTAAGITAPGLAFYDLKGKWAVENEGVTPDIEVENTAADVIRGHDPQLERAVKEALRLLDQSPVKHVPRPPPIDRTHPPQ